MAFSYVSINNNNPLLDIAEYIFNILKPIADLRFKSNGECGWISVSSIFFHHEIDVVINNMFEVNQQLGQKLPFKEL